MSKTPEWLREARSLAVILKTLYPAPAYDIERMADICEMALEALEDAEDGSEGFCPRCRRVEPDLHDSDCIIGNAIHALRTGRVSSD